MDKRRDRGLSVKETTDSPSDELVDCHSIMQCANKQPVNKVTPRAAVPVEVSDAMIQTDFAKAVDVRCIDLAHSVHALPAEGHETAY
jgi:hypothetical protein